MTEKHNLPQAAVVLVSCPDRRGLVAEMTRFIFEHGGNITDLSQYVDRQEGIFFARMEWDLDAFALPPAQIGEAFGQLAERLNMQWRLRFSNQVTRLALMVSKEDHCLYDVLTRWRSGELEVEIPLILSNHPDLKEVADQFDVPYFVHPITRETKTAQEQQQTALLKAHQVDLIVLARYMQILSPAFIDAAQVPIINIHHSFLPAFAGAKPYHQAYARGVKIIGATSHYVTADLDAGPIIAQDVVQVDHRDTVSDLIRKGRDVERVVLARALRHHLRHHVLVYNNKTYILGPA